MSAALKHRLSSSLFPILHALIYGILFALTESFISRNTNNIVYWALGGFLLGLGVGVVIQLALRRLQKRFTKVIWQR